MRVMLTRPTKDTPWRRRPRARVAAILAIAFAACCAWFAQAGAVGQAKSAVALPSPLSAFGADPPVVTAEQWRERRAPLLRIAFQDRIYGWLPPARPVRIASNPGQGADDIGLGDKGEVIRLQLGDAPGDPALTALLFRPPSSPGLKPPVVVVPNYCGNDAATGFRQRVQDSDVWLPERCRSYVGREIARLLHGDNIVRPPIKRLLRAGYAVITYYPGELVPDDPATAGAAISRLGMSPRGPNVGVIGAWAWSLSRIVDYVEMDPRLDAGSIAVFGHSRYGKASLLAAALDERISIVIANETGRFGAAPTRSPVGERVTSLKRRFPHWFPADLQPPMPDDDLDQHLLISLIAPRPVLLGGAGSDSWSDPRGAFESARAASDVYRLYESQGLRQKTPSRTDFGADLAAFVRPGIHGIARADWTATMAFLKAHWATPETAPIAAARSIQPTAGQD